MGSNTAPKMFNSGSAFGQSGGDSVTGTQPLATVANPGVPDISAYNQQQATPSVAADPNPDLLAGTGDPMSQFRKNRGDGSRVPFYGAMS